jgi:UDP-3-O-[3-hydroxymyristoyl] glucosamine N-acyltransferase
MPTLADIAALLGCAAPQGADRAVRGMGTLEEAGPEDLTFVGSESYAKQLPSSRAMGAIVHRKVHVPAGYAGATLLVDDADLAVARVLELFAPPVPRPPVGVDAMSRVAATAQLGQGIAVGPFCSIGERTRIGKGTVLHAGVYVGDDVEIGENCELYPRVVVRERITIGSRVIIHAGSVLGTDGFGYRWDGTKHAKVPQIGVIVVEDDVEIGSCVCVDRAKFSATRIGRGTKIDNLVQVAHNVRTGPECLFAGQAGVAGSVTLGTGVVLGGGVGLRDHIALGDGAMVAASSGVAGDVPAGEVVAGTPALPRRQALREQAALRHLPELKNQVKKLQDELEKLKRQLDTSS